MERESQRAMARELLHVARELAGMEFPTQDAMDKYLKEHPGANRSNHHVERLRPQERKNYEGPGGDAKSHAKGLQKHVNNPPKYLDEVKKVLNGVSDPQVALGIRSEIIEQTSDLPEREGVSNAPHYEAIQLCEDHARNLSRKRG